MKKLKLISLFVLGLSMSSHAYAQTDTIRFGNNPEYPPFEYLNESNEFEGFDIDLANAICETLKVKCEFVKHQFDALIPNLRLKRFDAVISSMDITDERKKQVTFSDSYYLNPAIYVVIKNKYQSIDDLKGKTVGLLNGSTHQSYIQKKHTEMKTKNYPAYTNAMSDLLINRVDAVFGDEATVKDYLKKNDQLVLLGKPVDDAEYFGSGLGIAVLPKNTELLNQINSALKTLKENGKYQAIYDKWFK